MKINMKKFALVLVAVSIFSGSLNTSTFAAELSIETADLTTDFSNSISSIVRSLVKRVEKLEKQVIELFEKIANIELTPGPQGPQGEKGDPGAPGINGIDGISGWEKIQSVVVQSSNREVVATAECSTGKKVLGGGYNVIVDGGTVQTLSNEPVNDTSWQVRIIGNVSFSAQAFALCASVQP